MKNNSFNFKFCTLLVVVAAFIFSSSSLSRLTGEKILKTANKAERQNKFVATLQIDKFSKGQKTTSLLKVYQKNSKIKMEYISPQSNHLVMIDDGANLCKLDLNLKKACISYAPSPKGKGKDQIENILKNYQIEEENPEKILNRECYVLNLKPKHKFGVHKKLWVDKLSWVNLKTEDYDNQGDLVVVSFYTQIDFKTEISDRIFMMPEDCQKFVAQNRISALSEKEIIKILGFRPVQPKYKPEGYELNGQYSEICIVGRPVAHLRYSDGLSSFSVFEHSKKGHDPDPPKETSDQDLADVSCLLPKDYQDQIQIRSKDDLILIIMGNLPEAEAKKVLQSVE